MKMLALGAEKLGELGRDYAAKQQSEDVQKRRQELIDYYRKHGYDAR